MGNNTHHCRIHICCFLGQIIWPKTQHAHSTPRMWVKQDMNLGLLLVKLNGAHRLCNSNSCESLRLTTTGITALDLDCFSHCELTMLQARWSSRITKDRQIRNHAPNCQAFGCCKFFNCPKDAKKWNSTSTQITSFCTCTILLRGAALAHVKSIAQVRVYDTTGQVLGNPQGLPLFSSPNHLASKFH